jgi:alpha-tubulin suppressor-like RCC1 family protein
MSKDVQSGESHLTEESQVRLAAFGAMLCVGLLAACSEGTSPQQAPPAWSSLSAGWYHTCGLMSDGAAYCWGNNQSGQLGHGDTLAAVAPVPVSGGLTFVSLTADGSATCGVTSVGAAYCWGDNSSGQLGNGVRDSLTGGLRTTPVAVVGGLAFASLAVGYGHTCGLTGAGIAYCWGNNSLGQLGNGSNNASNTPVAVAGGLTFASLTAHWGFTCGITSSGAAYCWGGNGTGELGNGARNGSTTPVAVAGGLTFTSLLAGYTHTCGSTSGGAAYCWGHNNLGQLGNGSTDSATGYVRTTPTVVAGALTFASVSVGYGHNCGVTSTGAAYCWGWNAYGQLGDSSRDSSTGYMHTTPTPVAGGLTFAVLSAGLDHTCGLTSSGAAYCWGNNTSGQLGDGSTALHFVPVAVRP